MRALRRLKGVSILVGGISLGLVAGLAGVGAQIQAVGDAAGIRGCQEAADRASEYGAIYGVIRGETTTIDAIVRWQEQRHPISGIHSRLRNLSGTAAAVVCLYSGRFVTPVPQTTTGDEETPPHDVLRVILLPDGSIRLDSAGYRGRMTPETPGEMEAQGGS